MGQDISAHEAMSSQLEAIPLAALFIDVSQRIRGVNRLGASLLGTGIEGQHFITVLRQPALLDAIEESMRDKSRKTTTYLTYDGAKDLTYHVTSSFVWFTESAGVLVCFEDRTHRQQAKQMRRDFVANVSHELRTPLTAIIGFIETLRGPAHDDSAARDRFLEIMQDEASRMERLVKDLLSLSRVESQQRKRPSNQVELGAVLETVIHSMQALARDHNVTIDLTYNDDARVRGDPDQLQQVFINLVENAIKYGGAGKSVEITMRLVPYDPYVRATAAVVSVTDQGRGIDPVHIPRLTERFYRVDTHRSRAMGGTGLGLAIVKHILNRHRGRLRIESKVGKGSKFKVIIPISEGITD